MTSSSPLRRIAQIVDAVAASSGGLALLDIANLVGLPPSTTHRTVNILLDVGYLALEPATKTYRIGERLKRVHLLTLGTSSLVELAKPKLVELSEHFMEAAYLVRLTGRGLQLADYCFPTKGSRTLVHPGFEFPLHATAAGKAVFAFQPAPVVSAELAKGLERYMPNTIVGKRAVKAELAVVRERGYAINDAELDPGVFAVAAPIWLAGETVIGAIAIVGIRDRLLARHKLESIAEVLVDAAAGLSQLMPQAQA